MTISDRCYENQAEKRIKRPAFHREKATGCSLVFRFGKPADRLFAPVQ